MIERAPETIARAGGTLARAPGTIERAGKTIERVGQGLLNRRQADGAEAIERRIVLLALARGVSPVRGTTITGPG